MPAGLIYELSVHLPNIVEAPMKPQLFRRRFNGTSIELGFSSIAGQDDGLDASIGLLNLNCEGRSNPFYGAEPVRPLINESGNLTINLARISGCIIPPSRWTRMIRWWPQLIWLGTFRVEQFSSRVCGGMYGKYIVRDTGTFQCAC